MQIDSHQDFWRYDAVRDAWITDAMSVVRRDFLPEDPAPDLNADGIDAMAAVQAEKDDPFLLRDDSCRGVSQLREFGFAYYILIYARQLPAAVEFVERFPHQPFVVDPLAKPAIAAGEIDGWERNADWNDWNAGLLAPYPEPLMLILFRGASTRNGRKSSEASLVTTQRVFTV